MRLILASFCRGELLHIKEWICCSFSLKKSTKDLWRITKRGSLLFCFVFFDRTEREFWIWSLTWKMKIVKNWEWDPSSAKGCWQQTRNFGCIATGACSSSPRRRRRTASSSSRTADISTAADAWTAARSRGATSAKPPTSSSSGWKAPTSRRTSRLSSRESRTVSKMSIALSSSGKIMSICCSPLIATTYEPCRISISAAKRWWSKHRRSWKTASGGWRLRGRSTRS